jgi:hypothetical protein
MAQGAVAPAPTNGAGPALSAEELREILEYERIVQFRDAVLAGTHPRVKIPPHLVGKQIHPTRNVSSPSASTPRANMLVQPARSTPGSYNEESSSFYNRSPNNPRSATGAHVPIPSKSEINPILLEKSDDLIKAEIQLQRQRLERALREQIEQRRIAAKALLQTSESLPSFDISEVLSKALAIVHPSTVAEVEPSVGARSSASDSFDENTFYSSQHDTPELLSPSQDQQKEPVDMQSRGVASVDERPAEFYSSKNQVGDRDVVITGASLSNDNHMQEAPDTRHSPSNQTRTAPFYEQTSAMANSESSSSRGALAGNTSASETTQDAAQSSKRPNNSAEAGNMASKQRLDQMVVQDTSQDLLQQAVEDVRASPLIRAHNLSPIAPQPARVSPLATAREPPVLRHANLADEAPPAQVAALRNRASGISSTDSSPKGAKASEKKKDKKKKKRKAKEAVDTPESPYIKPEPRSPSPFAVAPLPRPQKRQRQSGQYAAELNYDEPRFEHEEEVQEQAPERYMEARAPRAYERYEDRYDTERPRPEPAYRRVEREENDYRRVSEGSHARRPQSPAVYAVPYPPSEIRQVRAASHTVLDRRVLEEPRYYREPIPTASVRPDADRERSKSPILRDRRSPIPMGPPRKPLRIVIDEYGNEYIDPTPVPSMRQSVPPPIRYRESELVYERAPVRAVPTRTPIIEYDEERNTYRRASPALALPRRVATQPEYSAQPPEYRSYRQREYSVRPTVMAPPGEEYVQIRAPERRHVSHYEEAPREYAPRTPSVRPEPVRYEMPREYAPRLQSVRPEAPAREYAGSVRPEGRREIAPQAQREYSVRPVESVPRREYLAEPEGERYYEEMPRRPAEVAFIERPRARESSVMVYADDVRREVYK